LFDLVEAGKLKVLIDKVYPLEQADDAVQIIEDRAVFGKVVVTP
jgi:alcohol dehydrogenase